MATKYSLHDSFYVIFDGPPGPESGRFVDVENARFGRSIKAGEWIDRGADGWALGPFVEERDIALTTAPMLAVIEDMLDRVQNSASIFAIDATRDGWQKRARAAIEQARGEAAS